MLYARYAHPDNGYPHDSKKVAEILEVGKRYLVTNIDMGQCYTSVWLDCYNMPFNSVYFEFEEENYVPVNIYSDPRYNHYMKR